MNIIISKLDLPCDIKGVIHGFLYDKKGFNHQQCEKIKKAKEENEPMMWRIKLELWEWKRVDKNIGWLRKGGVYNVDGLDGQIGYEYAVFKEAYFAGLLFNKPPTPETVETRRAQGIVRMYQALVYIKQAQERLEQIATYGHTL